VAFEEGEGGGEVAGVKGGFVQEAGSTCGLRVCAEVLEKFEGVEGLG
jgi:hypothetical protein